MKKELLVVLVTLIAATSLLIGLMILFYSSMPSEAERTVIGASDLAGYAQGDSGEQGADSLGEANLTSGAYSILSNNGSWVLAQLLIFNSKEACEDYFQPWPHFGIQVGDESLGYYDNSSGTSEYRLVFIKKNVFVDFSVRSYASDPRSIALELAQVQIQKVDQYLARHPGAS
ncbi:MAG: hypothetical protein LUQ39_04330 [Methanomassiliicoccales archaeon]|nr:hypothetical protein [Methanomassiliicoccales archaeon]